MSKLYPYQRDMINRISAKRGVHIATGKTALIVKSTDGLTLAQFDGFNHRHSHGWHLYLRRDFKVVK